MLRLGNIRHPLVSKWRHLGIRANQLVRTQGVRFPSVYPSYDPIQACGLYLQTIGQSKAMIKAKDKNCRFGFEQSPHPPLPPPAPPPATSPPAALSKWSNSPTNALPKVVLVQEGGDSTLQNLTMIQYHRQLWKQRGSSKSRLQILHRQHTLKVTIKPILIIFKIHDYFLLFFTKTGLNFTVRRIYSVFAVLCAVVKFPSRYPLDKSFQ